MPDLPDKDEAIERLRKLKSEPEPREMAQESRGHLLGKRWAMADAHPNELARLEEFCQKYAVHRPLAEWKIDFHDRHAVKELLRELTLSILGYDRLKDREELRTKMKHFWEQRVGLALDRGDRPSVEFRAELVSGFAEGALAFWTEAKSRL